ncbi:MAG: PAS-domain containing protein [Rhodospirillales bacterium]
MSPMTAFILGGLIAALIGVPWALRERHRRKIAEQVRETAERHALEHGEILAAAPDGFFIWPRNGGGDPAGRCSRRLAVLLDLRAGTGATFEDVLARLDDEAAAALRQAAATLEATGKPFDIPLTLRAPSRAKAGQRRVRAFGTRAGTPDGRTVADLVWMRDIGETPEAQPAPEVPPEPAGDAPAPEAAGLTTGLTTGLDDRDVSSILDSVATPLAMFDGDARLRFFNAAYAAFWTLPPDWLAAKPSIEQVLDALRERRRLPEVTDFKSFKAEQRALFGTLRAQTEMLLHLPDGTTIKCIATPAMDGGLIFSYEDMTGRLALERSYNALVAVQGATLDRLYEAVAVFGSDGRLKLSNPVFASLWNIPPETLTPDMHITEFADYLRPSDVSDSLWPAQKETLIAKLMRRESSKGRLRRADGTILDYANVPLPDGATLLSYLDVTDSARVEEALTQRAAALDDANKLKSAFIANVSYEVRTPLNSILGFADVLADGFFGELSPRQTKYVEEIRETAQALNTVVGDILDLAAIEAGLMRLETDTVDIHAAMVSLLNLIRERARRKHLKLDFDCPPDIGWMVADERRLKQALYNLLANAIQFTPQHGTVSFKAAREGEDIIFSVADSGIGIPQADQARIFRAFERITDITAHLPENAAGNATGTGAGLGLSLVKSFIELHGGSVTLTSRPGRGTTFRCRLPGGDTGTGLETSAQTDAETRHAP